MKSEKFIKDRIANLKEENEKLSALIEEKISLSETSMRLGMIRKYNSNLETMRTLEWVLNA